MEAKVCSIGCVCLETCSVGAKQFTCMSNPQSIVMLLWSICVSVTVSLQTCNSYGVDVGSGI